MKSNKLSRYAVFAAVVFFVGTLFPYAYAAADNSLKKLRTLVDVIEFVKENYVETTWHHVEAWEGQANIVDFSKITKGCWVRVTGRLKTNSYTTSDNVEKYTMDIVANKLEVVVEDTK